LFLVVALAALAADVNMKEFQLSDLQGKPVAIDTGGSDVTALLFIATKCPISNDYNERMNAIYKEFAPKGVKFVFVNANSSEPAAEVADHAKQHQFAFAVYKDEGNLLADRLNAQATPEVFVFDRKGDLRYHGYVDDSRNAANIKVQGLRMALTALLAGTQPNPAETKAFGCTIKRARKAS